MAARLSMSRRSFRLPFLLNAELERIARRKGCSPSVLIRQLIADGLQRQPSPSPEQLAREMREELGEMECADALDTAPLSLEKLNQDGRLLDGLGFRLQRFDQRVQKHASRH